jgi:hypothetical protein
MHSCTSRSKIKKGGGLPGSNKSYFPQSFYDQNLPPQSEKPHRLGEASLLS